MSAEDEVARATAQMGRVVRNLARDIHRHALIEIATIDQRGLMAEGVRQMAAYWRDTAAQYDPQSVENGDCMALARNCDRFVEFILAGGKTHSSADKGGDV